MIESGTWDFLSKLKRSNNRPWFQKNKTHYLEARANFTDLVAILIHRITEFDESLIGVEPKDCLFRIYRDVRFSKDKSPYKTWLSAAMSGGGKNSSGPGYYIHLEPGNTYLGGGIWHPEKDHLYRIRRFIAEKGSELDSIVTDRTFKKYFGELGGEQLKTAPRGFPKDHPHIRWLRYKDYLAGCKLDDVELKSQAVIGKIAQRYEAMLPLFNFLRQAGR